MKVLDKIALVLFSSITLIASVILSFMILGWIRLEIVTMYVRNLLNNPTACNITLGILVVLILLAIKGIFFTTDSKKDKDKNIDNGILIQNENGKLLISRDTIQNLVSGVVKGFENTQDVTSKVILTSDNNINIDVTLFVKEDAIIKDLSSKLQLKIKEVIKQSIDIDIKEVNIKVRNIAPKEEKVEG
ncbi:MAG: alkaline shock response membrane anchor protein AmaP [Clostridia bacterium]|nr:alkaline shock response membrane anchor protein AmaP [Clostridia bacterium]